MRALRQAHAEAGSLQLGEMPAQKLVAEAHGFNVCFQDWIYQDDLDFTWRGNVRVALKGANGSGKSTLLKALLGGVFETRGQLRRGDLVAIYLDQRCSGLDDSKSVFENVRAVSLASESEIRNWTREIPLREGGCLPEGK